MFFENSGVIEKNVLKKTHVKMQIQWKLINFSTIFETAGCYVSPIFVINNVSWTLRLYTQTGRMNEFMSLYLHAEVKDKKYSLEYKFTVKKSDGSTHQLQNGIIKDKEEFNLSGYQVIERSDILQRKAELVPQDVLTIICVVKYEIVPSILSTASDKTMKLIRLDRLSENFKDLFNDKETCDTTLNVKDQEYKAHRAVLIARSSVFAATFKHDTLERQTGIVNILDCDPNAFAVFLKYLYCGKLEEISDSIALNLYYISDKYDIQEMKPFCVEYLIQHLTVKNICEVAVFSDKYDETVLFAEVQNFFTQNMGKIFITSEWQCFMKEDNRLANKLLIEMSKVKG